MTSKNYQAELVKLQEELDAIKEKDFPTKTACWAAADRVRSKMRELICNAFYDGCLVWEN
jgi:hypothetical protein